MTSPLIFMFPGLAAGIFQIFPGPSIYVCHQFLAFSSPCCFCVLILKASALGQIMTDVVVVHFQLLALFYAFSALLLGIYIPLQVLLHTTCFLLPVPHLLNIHMTFPPLLAIHLFLPVPALFVYRYSTFT